MMMCSFVKFMAQIEGFEPSHAVKRLAVFEAAPLNRLGKSASLPNYYNTAKPEMHEDIAK